MDQQLSDLLRKLNLHQYYPGKLKREDVVWPMSEDPDKKKIEKSEDLGMIFLHRLLSCNYEARDLEIITEYKSQITVEQVENPSSKTSRLAKRAQFSCHPDKSHSKSIHPLDVVLSVFLCADPILQQDIANLMWKCKLSIPFVTTINERGTPVAHIWPLRSICARWTSRMNAMPVVEEDNITSHHFLTIAFIRCGSTDIKKSNTINMLMSDTTRVHHIFYHRNSKGSTKKRLIADGMVEISWYLPNGSEENLCNEPTTVLNLRGDALIYHRQRKILLEMASICCIICSSSDIDSEEVGSIVDNIVEMKKKIFVITYDDKVSKGMGIIRIEEDLVIFNTESLSDAQLKEGIRSELKEITLKNVFQRTSIDKFTWKDISVDQEKKDIKEGFLQAETIMKSLICVKTECRKIRLLPLHQNLWNEWVEKDKEIHRLKNIPKSKDIQEYINELSMDKVNIRNEQFKIIQSGVSEAIANFLRVLDNKDKVIRTVCVRWLRIQMDQLSRRELRKILDKETIINDMISGSKDINEETKKRLEQELEEIQEVKNICHIGLEHFFRELGQIFEAIEAQPTEKSYNIGYDLPLLAARFLLDGNSLEILDGDAGAVPTTWVSAVFQCLSDMVKEPTRIDNPKCTVLTAYGMQSSGKSTLLNTMFGCQFATGAGRCTKGVQIQMLKANILTHERMNVDYVLLVDTEGVRSPRVPEKVRRTRDNEITTFVIGLGQKTLINLMGENTTYLTEVLPIAVRAFLRMGIVGLRPSCAIVYQNVDSESSIEISDETKRLKDELDNQTIGACQMERIAPPKKFKDIITFDVDQDIHYIPSLWEGKLPMATVSQGYSKSTLDLKDSFRQFFHECTSQELISYSSHIKSLWTAIVKDNFVYVFQNAQETEARERMDKFLCDVVWKLRMKASKSGTKVHTKLMNCPDSAQLEKISTSCTEKVKLVVASMYEDQKIKLEDFFNGTLHTYKQYMKQWIDPNILHLTKIRNKLIRKLKSDIERLRLLKNHQFSVEKRMKQFKASIRNEIFEHFKRNRKHSDGVEDNLPEEEIVQVFETKWKGWLDDLKPIDDEYEQKTNIPRKAVDVLREKFSSHENLVIQKSDTLSSGKIMVFQLQESHLLANTNNEDALIQVRTIVQKTIESVRERLTELTQNPLPYKNGSLEEIIEMVSTNEHELQALGIKTTKEFEIDISMSVASMAVSAFSNSHNKFIESFHPSVLLEQEKESFFILFETYYKKTSFTLSFARRVTELLITAIKNRIVKKIAGEVANDMKTMSSRFSAMLAHKQSFMCTILCQMVSDGVFRRFMDYIQNPKDSTEYWLGRYVDEYSSEACDDGLQLNNIISMQVRGCLRALAAYSTETEKQLEEMDKSNDVPVRLWVEEFTDRASKKFEVSQIRGLSDIVGDQMLDIRYFCLELLKQIETMTPNFDDLTTKGMASYNTMREEVVRKLMDSVIGCTGHCPFCGEVCVFSLPNHGGLHATPIHRPEGCHGYSDIDTNILAHENCQTLVASKKQFRNKDTHGIFVPYEKYNTIYANWSIPGDAHPRTSSLWSWFMFTYIENLETEHNALRPVMPKVWETYTKEGEIRKLKEGINSFANC